MTRMVHPDLANSSPWRHEFRATLALAWPLVLSNLTGALIHATDVLLLGRLGAQELAAGALGTNLVMAVMIFGMGLVTATAPMLAATIGAKAHSVRDVRRTVRQGLWAAIAFTVPFWIVMWNAKAIFLILGQDPKLSADAGLFVRAMMWGILPFLGMTVLRAYFSALEHSIWTLVVGVIGVVANAVLNYGLIFGELGLPKLGLVGAGIGSSIVYTLMFVAMALIIVRHPKFRRYHLFGRWWRSDWPRFGEIWRLGSPIALTMGFEVTVFSAAVFLMGLISTASVGAHAVALQIAALAFMVPMGVAQAATVRVGIGYGKRDSAMIARAGQVACVLGVGFMCCTAILLVIMPETLARLFIDTTKPGNAEVLRLATSFLIIAAIFQIVDGAQVVGAGMLRGLQDTRVPMIYALFGYWVVGLGVGAGLAFPGRMEGIGIWIGLASGLAVVSLLMLWRWIRRDALGLLPKATD